MASVKVGCDNPAYQSNGDVGGLRQRKSEKPGLPEAEIYRPDEAEDDPYALLDPPDKGKAWKEKTAKERFTTVVVLLMKLCVLIGLLYMFICSLDFLSNAFRLLGGSAASEAFTHNVILSNPIGLLMLGVLATVLVQSSSTSTSIVVSMVNAGTLTVRPAIFIVMGANIGTSVTNTLVAMTQSMKKHEFRRAFAGATVHDMFNWLTVIILLPIEWISGSFGSWKGCGILCQMTGAITDGLAVDPKVGTKQELLKAITKPLTKKIIEVDKKVLQMIARNETDSSVSIIKRKCAYTAYRIAQNKCEIEEYEAKDVDHCHYMFADAVKAGWSDQAIGACLLVFAILILCLCLVLIVKLLHSVLRGQMSKIIRKFFNAKFPGCFSHLTGYLAILLGAGITILVQSSSIFTSAITPLVGMGVLHLKRMYPLTLGANVGTTVTALLAALASERSKFQFTLQVALCHLFFNIIGIMIWYPVPTMRNIPISLARKLGNTTAKYRWFAIVYIICMFFLMPAGVFGLSVAGWKVCLGVLLPIVLLFIFVTIVNILQTKKPGALPEKLRTWECLPLFLHSFRPYDALCMKCCCCCKSILNKDAIVDEEEKEEVPEITITKI